MAAKKTKKPVKAAPKAAKNKTPEGIPPVKKMIDLTKDKTDPKAQSFWNAVNKYFTKAIKSLHIPICDMFATNPYMLNDFIVSRGRYLDFTGDCANLIDQCFRDAMAETILASLVRPELKDGTYPGKWDEHNMFALARSRVNLIIPRDKPELGSYLTCFAIMPGEVITTERMEAEGMAINFLKMSDVNPNRLYQFAVLTAKVIIQTMMDAIKSTIPMAALTVDNSKLVTRYGTELVKLIKPTVERWSSDMLGANGMTFRKKMERLCQEMYTPIFEYIVYLLSECGIRDVYVRNIMNPDVTKIEITYYTDTVEDILDTKSVVQYGLGPVRKDLKRYGTDEPYNGKITLAMSVGQLYRMAMTDVATHKKMDLNEIGTQVKNFVDQFQQYCFNMYLIDQLFLADPDEPEKYDPPETDVAMSTADDAAEDPADE